MKSVRFLAALALGAALPLAVPTLATPAVAAVDANDPTRFIDTLTAEGFAVLRTGDKKSARVKFRALLTQHFAVDQIGDRLIRRWSGTITADQRAAYKEAFPNFIIGTYADRLFEYADADLKIVRATPAGGGVDVVTQVTRPGQSPILTVWSVARSGNGYKVTNLKVAGINLSISQAADFDAIIQRRGFDQLISMMRARGRA